MVTIDRRTFGRRLLLAGAALQAGTGAHPLRAAPADPFEPGAELERVPGSFNFTEGPVPDAGGNVYFSDYRNRRICVWSADGELSVFLEDTGGIVGLDIAPDGALLAASTNGRTVLSIDRKTKKTTVLADRYGGKRLNSPNDIVCDAKGGVYFTDPRFVPLPEPKEQDVEGVYYLSPDKKRLVRVIDDLRQPNGLALSPDSRLLYVDDTPEDTTWVYEVGPDGSLSGKRRFASTGFDGLTVDADGNVYITSEGISVHAPSGEKIGGVDVPVKPTNVSFGGRDMRTLFITTNRTAVFTIRMRARGIPREQSGG